ncbi:MAG: 50S ribosomal protein L22 [Planctomycetota bacterium]
MANHTKRNLARQEQKDARRAKFFSAHHKYARMSASKVRLDADLVRGLPINRALEQLQFSNRRGSYLIDKVTRSALANAEYQISERDLDIDVDTLYIQDIQVGEGPILKRWMTRARGMAFAIQKHSCHISVTLSPKADGDEDGGKPKGKKAKKKGGKKAVTAGN